MTEDQEIVSLIANALRKSPLFYIHVALRRLAWTLSAGVLHPLSTGDVAKQWKQARVNCWLVAKLPTTLLHMLTECVLPRVCVAGGGGWTDGAAQQLSEGVHPAGLLRGHRRPFPEHHAPGAGGTGMYTAGQTLGLAVCCSSL